MYNLLTPSKTGAQSLTSGEFLWVGAWWSMLHPCSPIWPLSSNAWLWFPPSSNFHRTSTRPRAALHLRAQYGTTVDMVTIQVGEDSKRFEIVGTACLFETWLDKILSFFHRRRTSLEHLTSPPGFGTQYRLILSQQTLGPLKECKWGYTKGNSNGLRCICHIRNVWDLKIWTYNILPNEWYPSLFQKVASFFMGALAGGGPISTLPGVSTESPAAGKVDSTPGESSLLVAGVPKLMSQSWTDWASCQYDGAGLEATECVFFLPLWCPELFRGSRSSRKLSLRHCNRWSPCQVTWVTEAPKNNIADICMRVRYLSNTYTDHDPSEDKINSIVLIPRPAFNNILSEIHFGDHAGIKLVQRLGQSCDLRIGLLQSTKTESTWTYTFPS